MVVVGGMVVGVVVVGVAPVVDVVEEAPQQKPTSCGASCTSRGLQTSRIFTELLKVPSLRCRAQSTAALAEDAKTSKQPATMMRIGWLYRGPPGAGQGRTFGFRPGRLRGCAASCASTRATRSPIDQSLSVTPAASAGLMRSVLCIFTKLYQTV